METLSLSPRLAAIAARIPDGASVADVGTDHGFLPAYLALMGHTGQLTASDIAEGPLASARRNAEKYGVADKIEFVLSDGLRSLPPRDVVVAAGMGGETVISVLTACPWPLTDMRLLLQPQTKLPELRLWLWENGFDVLGAELSRDAGRLYVIWEAETRPLGSRPTPAELYADRRLLEARDALLPEWLDRCAARAERSLRGLVSGGRGDTREAEEYRELIMELRTIREETKRWRP